MAEPILMTGAGIVCAIGLNKSEVLDSLCSERTGIGPIRYLKTVHQEFPVGEVKLSNEEMSDLLDIPCGVPTTRTSLMGMLALDEALKESALAGVELNDAVFISGTTVGGMDKSEQFYQDFLTNDSHNAYIATHDCGSCTEMIADHFGRFSFVTSISTACSSAANAIITGANMIQAGMTDIAVVGGSECITKFHLNGFNSLMILDHEHCRPFDASRAGLNLGEGAAYIVLERASSAKRRGVRPLACLAGYGNACDAYHQTASSEDGEGAFLAMKEALDMAGIQPSAIGYVNAHGTGTPNNDLSESAAMRRLFGDAIPPVSSTKSFTGHTTSASGSIEAVICLLAMNHRFCPVNLNWRTPADDCIIPVHDCHANGSMSHVLCNSFGFGGNDSSLLLSDIHSISI